MGKHFFLAFVFVLGFCWICAGEDLGELAKKEKARREELARKGVKSRTYTNEDLADLKAQLAIQPSSTETSAETTTAPAEPATTEAGEPAAKETTTSEESTEETATDQQLKDIQTQKEEQEAKAKAAKGAIDRGGLFHTRDIGEQYRVQREADEKIRGLDKKTDELKKQQEEEEEETEEQ
ncbi:MAG TPA: hypothetical protein VJ521_09135 [Acidobacteriota bacterium]|nr:hypothetical protein [Acidobacteriota bacterium]